MSDRDKQSEMEKWADMFAKKQDWHSCNGISLNPLYKRTYQQGWTDALKHAPEVLAFVEALEHAKDSVQLLHQCRDFIERQAGTSIDYIFKNLDDIDNNDALTTYQKAIEEQK